MKFFVPVLTLGSLGFLFGLGLALAAKKFCVITDPKLEKMLRHLPGSNCGACGMPGCSGFAQGLMEGSCRVGQCAVMQDEQRGKIAKILGVEIEEKIKTVAVLHCNGGKKVKNRFQYNGLIDCTAANLVMKGQKSCVWGCLGFAACVRACPFEAIVMDEEKGLPVVLEEKCRACGKCVEACPKKLFNLIPQSSRVVVACKSSDLGKDARLACSVGCIACRRCEKACPVDAIHVVDNLAIIDYNKCTSCGECVKVCPTKTIMVRT